MSETPNTAELLKLAKRLVFLLEKQELGLFSWRELVHRTIDDIAAFHRNK